MEDRRITIPAELIKKSDLKDASKVIISLEENGILLRPYTEDLEDINVIAVRRLDKRRIILPKVIHINAEEAIPVLYNGEIWIKRCVI